MLNIDCNGNVSSFSPELLGYKNERYNNFIIGNVHQHTSKRCSEPGDGSNGHRHPRRG